MIIKIYISDVIFDLFENKLYLILNIFFVVKMNNIYICIRYIRILQKHLSLIYFVDCTNSNIFESI